MKRIMRYFGLAVLTAVVAACATTTAAPTAMELRRQRPAWTKRPPRENDNYVYFVGVSKTFTGGDYGGARRDAERAARVGIVDYLQSDISTEVNEIKSTSGPINDSINPKLLSKSITRIVAASVTKMAKGVEYYEESPKSGSVRSFVLMRYPKAEMKREIARKKREQVEKVKSASNLYKQAKRDVSRRNISGALEKSVRARYRLTNLPLVAISDNTKNRFGLKNEVNSLYQSLLRATKVSAAGSGQTGYDGQALGKPLTVQFSYQGSPVRKIPVQFAFRTGRGELSPEKTYSDERGRAVCRVTRVDSIRSSNIVTARVFFPVSQHEDPVEIKELSQEFVFASKPSGRNSILIVAEEKELGKPSPHQRSKNYLAEALVKEKYRVVDEAKIEGGVRSAVVNRAVSGNKQALQRLRTSANAGVLALAKVYTYFSSNVQGIIFVKGTIELKLVRLSSGKVLFQKEIADIKGADLTKAKASRKAVRACSQRMAKALAAFLKTSDIKRTE